MQTAGSHTHALASSQKCGIFWTFSQEKKKKKKKKKTSLCLGNLKSFLRLPPSSQVSECVSHAEDAEQLSFTDSSERTKTAWVAFHVTRATVLTIIYEKREPIYHWKLKVCQEVKINANWKRSHIKICQAVTQRNSFRRNKDRIPKIINYNALGWRLTREGNLKYPTFWVMRLDDSFAGRYVLFLTC